MGEPATATALERVEPVELDAPRPSPTRHYTKATAAGAIDKLEESMGGREGLLSALLQIPTSDPLMEIVGILADPAQDARKLSQICAEYKIGVGDVLEAYKRGTLAIAQVQAIHAVAGKLVPVVTDVMERAAKHEVECDTCDGVGTVAGKTEDAAPVQCRRCKGKGTLKMLPELARQKFAVGLAGLGESNAPAVSVNVTQQTDNRSVNISPSAGKSGTAANMGFDRLTAASDAILFGGANKARVVQTEMNSEAAAAGLPDAVVDAVLADDDSPDV